MVLLTVQDKRRPIRQDWMFLGVNDHALAYTHYEPINKVFDTVPFAEVSVGPWIN